MARGDNKPRHTGDQAATHPSQEQDPALVFQSRSSSFSGPIPPPQLLAQYNEIIPNGAERIMVMAERQSAHRESLEAMVITGNVASQTRGSYFAFIICMTALIFGFILILSGRNAVGLAAIISALAGVAATFIYSKHQQSKERIEKAAAFEKRKNAR